MHCSNCVGRKAFCAGADLSAGIGTFTLGLDEPMTDFGKLARVVRNLGVPLVGRVNGDCVAGGMGLMSLCDLIVVADHARFGLPEAKVGVFPMQVLVFLRTMIGARHVNELCLTGDLINAARAYEIGIANYVVPFEELDARIDALTLKLAEMSPVALRRGKYAIAAMEQMAFAEALAFAETLISVTALTGDAAEDWPLSTSGGAHIGSGTRHKCPTSFYELAAHRALGATAPAHLDNSSTRASTI